MDNVQTNTRPGAKVLPAGVDLTDKEGYLVKVGSYGGAPAFLLPTDPADYAIYVLEDGASVGENAQAIPLSPDHNRRAKLSGTCSSGDQLVLAGSGSYGKVVELPAVADTYLQVGIAEEDGVDGQNVLFRPSIETVVVE